MDALSDLYVELREEDMWTGLWLDRCNYPETARAISFEQQGFFKQAQAEYEKLANTIQPPDDRDTFNYRDIPEFKLWQDHWIRCSKELNQVCVAFSR